MTTPLLSNLRILAAKIEGTPGTAETLADADYNVRVFGPINVTPNVPPDDEGAKYQTGDHGEDESIMGAQSATISFMCKIAWGGAVGTEPDWWKFAKGCGCGVTTFGATGLALEPLKQYDNQSLTIEIFDIERGGASPNARKYQFAGCMGNMILSSEGVGLPWVAQFEFQGKFVDVTDVVTANILDLTSPSTTTYEKLLANPMTIGGVSKCISSFSLDIGNTISPQMCQGEATGYELFAITARRPRLTVNPLAAIVATDDTYGKMVAQTRGAVSLATAAASPHFTIAAPDAQIISLAYGDRDGLVSDDMTYKLLRNAGSNSNMADEAGWHLLQGAYA